MIYKGSSFTLIVVTIMIVLSLMTSNVHAGPLDCRLYTCVTTHAYEFPPGYEDDDIWICENAPELCEEYEVPDCPGCIYKICYVTTGTRKITVHCTQDLPTTPPCPEGPPSLGPIIPNGHTSGPQYDIRENGMPWYPFSRAIICPAPECPTCEVPQSFLDRLDALKNSWEANFYSEADAKYFHCVDGDCRPGKPVLEF